MKTFYYLLANGLLVAAKNNFVWFALTFWAYLETHSVVTTSLIGGSYLLATALSGFWLGSIVDHNRKKKVLMGSCITTLGFFLLGFILFNALPETAFTVVSSPFLWIFILILMCGVIAGNLYGIVIPTLVTHLVDEEDRDKANGMFGTVMGVAFSFTSIGSGLTLAYAGMFWVLVIAILLTVVAMIHLTFIPIKENKLMIQEEHDKKGVDVWGTIKAIGAIPGLFALIFFTMFNNFLGGVFMALMDAYGLTLVEVQVWGLLWGFLSMGFILGGIIIAKKGLGKNPLSTLMKVNMMTWTVCIFFTVQPSIILLTIGTLIWIVLVPFIEATEQTIIQKVVPPERQGRVFGFAHSVEQAASPLTAFFIGPITQYVFIPFMTTGAGVELIGHWYGTGPGRGIALVFSVTGIIGLFMTFLASRSRAHKVLAEAYMK